MENETKISDAIKEWWGVTKAIFEPQKDNQMFKDLQIVKGFKNGFGYLIYMLFVLPAKIIKFFLNPSWTWVQFTQKHLISPVFEIDALTGSESPSRLLGEILQKNLNYFKTTNESGVSANTLKPSIDVLERIMIFAKIRVIMTLIIFAIIGFEMSEYIYDLLYEIVDFLIVSVTYITTYIGFTNYDSTLNNVTMFGGLTFAVMLAWTGWIFVGSLVAYWGIFAIRFIVESMRSVMYADRTMMIDFVDDTLHYTITKAIEIYGEDVALKAYDLLLENVVTEVQRYETNEPHYKRIEHLKQIGKKQNG